MLRFSQYLEEGVNDPAIFKAVFLAGGPGSGKTYVVKQIFGIPDRFIEHASREEMLEDSGLLAKQILDSLKEWI